MRIEALSRFRKSVFSILCKVQSRFEQDANIYLKAINAFVTMAEIIVIGNDSSIQKALFTFGKEVVQAVKKGRRKYSGRIPVQSTARSRRKIKHRGAGPSLTGRPTNIQKLRLQLNVQEEEELVSHKLPGQKHKPKNPHSLSKAV